MTAEIAVLNRDAVALAADSTVTIEGSKAYHTINKLFSLSVEQPVGIMVYGSGALSRVPWETIIKLYRSHIGHEQRDELFDYVVDFINFLESEFSENLFEDERAITNEYIDEYICALYDRFQSTFEDIIESGDEISDYKAAQILRNTVKSDAQSWSRKQKLLPLDSDSYKKSVMKAFDKRVDRHIENYFENVSISKDTHRMIIDVIADIFLSHFELESGVVFSGYGLKEIYPVTVEIRVECFFKGKLKFDKLRISKIGRNQDGRKSSNARINPYAQKEVVDAFMRGYSTDIYDQLTDDLREGRKNLLTLIDDESHLFKDNNSFEEFRDKIKEGFYDFYKDVLAKISQISKEKHIQPVMRAISMLPKNELAEVAETLVSLTSFSQKVSLEQETVGGAVDVAVISKGDGFVWIKRKHYFEADLNPMFMSKYLPRRS